MPRYNFSEISDFDFEELCRDLMQEELGLSLELFAPGRDQGIDFRHVGFRDNGAYTIVGQCKRWAQGSFSKLLWHLKNEELPKIQRLAPHRYILMTSVELSPEQKSNIITALAPWVTSPQDIKGRDDITGLLSRYSEIRNRYIKLWLTSGEVLDAFLHSDIRNRSDYTLEQAKRQIRLWVPNDSFSRARSILEDNHVCIISGAPGIGKTMLGEILLAGYSSLGYEPISISADIKEGYDTWRPDHRQVFLYDDFLGQVTYGELHLRKNEPSDLASFIDRVRNNDNKRFILTTREYILSEAMLRYEHLPDTVITFLKNVVSLEDYTGPIRARILYNHLFYSDLPQHLKTALLPGKKYWDVINHPNYNPRVIGHATTATKVAALEPETFVAQFLTALNDPTEIWKSAFENLKLMERRILLAIASLPTEVFLHDLRDAVKNLWQNTFDPGEFARSLNVLEGTFVDIKEAFPGSGKRERLVVIRDPSVRDYLWGRFEEIDGEAEMLLDGAIFFEQCVILYEGQSHAIYSPAWRWRQTNESEPTLDVVDYANVARRGVELIQSVSALTRRSYVDQGIRVSRRPVDMQNRVAFLISVLKDHPETEAVVTSVVMALEFAKKLWNSGHGSPRTAVGMLRQLLQVHEYLEEDMLNQVQQAVYNVVAYRLSDTDMFESLVDLAYLDTNLFEQPRRGLKSWAEEFETFLADRRDHLIFEEDDPDWLESEMRDIRKIADAMDVDIDDLEHLVDERIDELRSTAECDEADELPDIADDSAMDSDEDEEEKIEDMFQSLLSSEDPQIPDQMMAPSVND